MLTIHFFLSPNSHCHFLFLMKTWPRASLQKQRFPSGLPLVSAWSSLLWQFQKAPALSKTQIPLPLISPRPSSPRLSCFSTTETVSPFPWRYFDQRTTLFKWPTLTNSPPCACPCSHYHVLCFCSEQNHSNELSLPAVCTSLFPINPLYWIMKSFEHTEKDNNLMNTHQTSAVWS